MRQPRSVVREGLVTGLIGAVAVIVTAVLAEVRKTPHLLWLLAEFFLVFEFGFYGVIAVVLAPVSAELAWINVAVGNLIAAGGMGYYLWRTNPVLRQTLQRHLAGAPAGDTEGASENRSE